MAKGCGCGSDQNKGQEQCPSAGDEKKSGFSQSPCKKDSGKGKCHESHAEFKKKGGKSKGDKCGSGSGEKSKESTCGGSSKNECSDSYKKFQESIQDDCSNSQQELSQREQFCEESRPKSVPCSAQTKPDPCSEANNSAQSTKRGCQSNITRGPCSMDLVSAKKESPCSSKRARPEDGSMCSKITSRCKDMAKDFVKARRNTKCSGVDESLQGGSICNKPAPPASLPCPPKTEKSVGYGPPCCTSRVTCAESKASTWADFFPLDARNQKLNACIEKYSKLDPGKVVSQCSQFVNKAMDTSERCTQQARKVQQQCLQTVKSTPDAVKRVALLSTRQRALINRWAPSAGLYLATSALITLYLTEWKSVPLVYQDFTGGEDEKAKPS